MHDDYIVSDFSSFPSSVDQRPPCLPRVQQPLRLPCAQQPPRLLREHHLACVPNDQHPYFQFQRKDVAVSLVSYLGICKILLRAAQCACA